MVKGWQAYQPGSSYTRSQPRVASPPCWIRKIVWGNKAGENMGKTRAGEWMVHCGPNYMIAVGR